MDTENTEILAFKGFDENFKCRGYQYEVGKTYTHDGEVEACSSGFHSCADPFDVLNYYDITSRFAAVSVGGELSYHEDDSKIASSTITIKAELKLPDFIRACLNSLAEDADPGYCSQLAASGDYSKLAASGEDSKLAASGDYSKLAASGDDSKLAASGYGSQLAASGDDSIAISAGCNSIVKAGVNGALALTRWVESEQRYRISVAYVGEDGIKPDVWYKLSDTGDFEED